MRATNAVRILFAFGAGLFLIVSSVAGQTLTPTVLGVVAGKREASEGEFRKLAENKSAQSGVALLSQADVTVDSETTEVGLQAMDLFFSKDWRLYVRSTLPIPEGDKDTVASDTDSTLPSSAVSALIDPYGGVLNLAAGALTKIRVSGESQDDPDHGLFVDARFGLKFVNLPGQSERAPSVLNTSVTPFYSAALMLKLIQRVFPKADSKDVAGGFEFGIGGVLNVAADESSSKAFAGNLLDKTTTAVRCDLALSLTSVAAIGISWTPWSSNDGFGKRFIMGLKLLNQSPVVK